MTTHIHDPFDLAIDDIERELNQLLDRNRPLSRRYIIERGYRRGYLDGFRDARESATREHHEELSKEPPR